MSPVSENVIPVPEVVEHFGDSDALTSREWLAVLGSHHVRCILSAWRFSGVSASKESAYRAALPLLSDAIDAQCIARGAIRGGAVFLRARTLRCAALVAVKAADAL